MAAAITAETPATADRAASPATRLRDCVTVFVDLPRKLSITAVQIACAAMRRLTDHPEDPARMLRAAP